MADTKSSETAEAEEVTLTNVSRRPLLVRLPGKTLRFGPGDRQTVPKALLATTELLRMCEQRFVVVSPISQTKVEVFPAEQEETAAPPEGAPEVSASTETQPTMEAVAPESQPLTEASAASGSESDSAAVQPGVSPEGAATSQAGSKEKKSNKPKPNLAKQ